MRVGLFDSGVGGLTVLKSLMDRYPHNEYIYFGDTLNNPYGSKSKSELLKLSTSNMEFLLSKNVDVVIIACGTVSSNCLSELKSKYNTLIYDIISPIINYINNSNYNNILVIATERTIESHVFKDRIIKNVYEVKAPKLVPLIENNISDSYDMAVCEYLEGYTDKIDAIILGCTHYPLIIDSFRRVLNNDVMVLDMANFLDIDDGNKSGLEVYFSKLTLDIINNTKRILELDNLNIKEIDISKY